MKKTLFILFMCAIALSSKAQKGWLYGDNVATIKSTFCSLENDRTGTSLTITIGLIDDVETAVCVLDGHHLAFNFRENQKYVVISTWKFDIMELDRKDVCVILDTPELIELLSESDIFSISVPVYGVGTTTFYFNTDGYPLDW